MAKITCQHDAAAFECAPGDTILRAALRAGQGMSYSCNTGSCGNCRFELIEGAVTHARADAPAWSDRDLKRNRWLGCQAVPDGDCTIKFRPDPDAVSRDLPAVQEAVLVSVSRVTHDISEFSFAVDAPFRPGQYALIGVPGVDGARAYSMSNIAGEGVWRFLIKRVPAGAATGHLFEVAKPGDRLTLDGPYGTAWLREDSPRDIVLMAGGSGLSPMVSIAKGIEAAGMIDTQAVRFFYGGRAQADLFDAAAILGADLAERVRFTPALSRPDPGWEGDTGLLHAVVAELIPGDLRETEVYFAGPAAMSQAVQQMVHDLGAQMNHVHFDEFY